jgi:hypothetical protein
VLKNKMVRGSVAAVAALAIPVLGVSALGVNPAAAAKPHGIQCSVLKGSANTSTGATKITLSTCTGNTGTKGTAKGQITDTSSTIKWANGKSTNDSESLAAGTGCPGSDTTEVESGVVNTDTTGSTTVGAAVTATVCIATTSNPDVVKISLLKGTKFIIAA